MTARPSMAACSIHAAGDIRRFREHFLTRAMQPIRCAGGEIVSSTRIRALRQSGAFEAAAALQGWSRAGSLPVQRRAEPRRVGGMA